MAYSAEISRSNPTCFIFLIDQSGSMVDAWGGETEIKKSQKLADIINRQLQNLIIRCAKAEGVRDYFHIAVIGYGNNVGSAFGGSLARKELVPISEVANTPVRLEDRAKKVEDGAGGLIDQTIKFPVWFDPIANGGTPMCQALNYAHTIVENWIKQYPNCYPPIVINITDGEANDGDPSEPAENLKNLCSTDGNVVLFNLHLSSQKALPIEFPDTDEGLVDQYAQLLFKMSSYLPQTFWPIAREHGYNVTENTKAFAFQADMITAIKFLDIGTRPSDLR